MSRPIRSLRVTAGVLAFLLIPGGSAWGGSFIGIDRNGDLRCDPAFDMSLRRAIPGGGGVGASSFDLFFDGVPNPLSSIACTFCVADSSAVHVDSFVYNSPEGWSDSPLLSDPPDQSDWISRANPSAKCWIVQSTDFSFLAPWDAPGKIGTVYYSASSDGPLDLILDGVFSGYFTTAFTSGPFCDVDSVQSECQCISPAPTEYLWRPSRTLTR